MHSLAVFVLLALSKMNQVTGFDGSDNGLRAPWDPWSLRPSRQTPTPFQCGPREYAAMTGGFDDACDENGRVDRRWALGPRCFCQGVRLVNGQCTGFGTGCPNSAMAMVAPPALMFPPFFGQGRAVSPEAGPCQDASPLCSAWASQGECATNAAFMRPMCRRSCAPVGECPGTNSDRQLSECTNRNANCFRWAAQDECVRNLYFMRTNCGMACRESMGDHSCNGQQYNTNF